MLYFGQTDSKTATLQNKTSKKIILKYYKKSESVN